METHLDQSLIPDSMRWEGYSLMVDTVWPRVADDLNLHEWNRWDRQWFAMWNAHWKHPTLRLRNAFGMHATSDLDEIGDQRLNSLIGADSLTQTELLLISAPHRWNWREDESPADWRSVKLVLLNVKERKGVADTCWTGVGRDAHHQKRDEALTLR